MRIKRNKRNALLVPGTVAVIAMSFITYPIFSWQSKFVKAGKNGSLTYVPDDKGNIIPDFSRVGFYQGDRPIPEVAVVTTIIPSPDAMVQIQAAIDALAEKTPDQNGYRGAILLKKGEYKIPGTITIKTSGIILRGEGDQENGTRLIATAKNQEPLIAVSGTGGIKEVAGSRISITDSYVPAGTHSFAVQNAGGFAVGDPVILYQPASDEWIKDLKMDQIENRGGTRQWKPAEYNLSFERIITRIEGNTIFIDNPVMMAIDARYGGGQLFKYTFEGRLQQVGIEQLYCESAAASDTAENHAWDAITFNKIENGWIRHVTARYFSYSCVNLGSLAKQITVTDARCFDHKSKITGGRRYSFNNNGQLNFFMNCTTSDGRHDYVTGARVLGPNVFYHCSSTTTHADIGPHHRWAVGTLYDNIVTDGDINVQDRGNWGSGHGWAGVTQVVWNCTARKAAVQNPWAAGKNYCIGLKGGKYEGRLKGRPDGEWEGQNQEGLQPASLYLAQLKARQKN